jgi:AcrR family transcriptional regulator
MPRDATTTRQKLLRAGEQLFAAKGVDGALVRDIIRLAGQANDSAIHYHFGSRQGLLEAILARHIELMEAARREREVDGGADLEALVAALVEPTAARLLTPEGRDFLRIVVRLAGHAGVRSHAVPSLLQGTAVAHQLKLIEQSCLAFLPEPIALERVATLISVLTATLADRALRIEQRRRLPLDHETFVANLISMLTAAMRAPAP